MVQYLVRLTLAFLLMLSAWPAGAVPPASFDYCVVFQCFPSLDEAEAHLRSQTESEPSFATMRFSRSYVANDGTVQLVYRPTDVAVEVMGQIGYIISGAVDPCAPAWSPFPGISRCVDESEAISDFITQLGQVEDLQILGDYESPFAEVFAFGHLRQGVVNYGGNKRIRWTTRWDDGSSLTAEAHVQKWQEFKCPDGYEPYGVGLSRSEQLARWGGKVYCYSNVEGVITARINQTKSCPANSHPCFPATGDKARFEPAFELGGVSFENVYHSVRQFSSFGLPSGWVHSFGARLQVIKTSPLHVVLVDDRGYVDQLRSDGIWWPFAKSVVNTGRVVTPITLPDSSQGYVLEEGDLLKTFWVDGRLLEIRSRSDASIGLRFAYEGSYLASATDVRGRFAAFRYEPDPLGGGGLRLQEIDLPDGGDVTYTYDTEGRISRIAQGGVGRTYHYSGTLLTGITDESNQPYAAFTYDARGRVTSSQLLTSVGPVEQTTLVYGADGSASVVTPTGEAVQYLVSDFSAQRAIATIDSAAGAMQFESNTYGGLNAYTDRKGVRTGLGYFDGRLSVKNEAMGTDNYRRTSYQYNSDGGLSGIDRYDVAEVSAPTLVHSARFAYDASGLMSARCEMDPQLIDPNSYACGSALNAPPGVRQTKLSRCTAAQAAASECPYVGAIVAVDGARTDVSDATSFEYYNADHVDCATSPTTCAWRKGDLWKVTNAQGQVTETLRYDGAGRALTVKDANGVTTDLEYHPRGWLTARKVRGVDGGGEGDDQITRIAYYPTGSVSSTTLPDGSFMSYVYDAAHRLTDIVDADGNRVHFTLDGAGNRTKEEVKGSDDSLKRTLSRVYNQLGQLQTIKDAGSHPSGFSYDANSNLENTTDALGRVSDNDYDPLNRLSRTLLDVAGIAAETQFKYDAQDNLTEVIDPKGLSTKYQYNAFGNVRRLESPDTGIANYNYDAVGNRTGALDARGEQSTFTYDALNRLTAIGYSDAALNVGYTYDIAQSECAAGETFAAGRLSRVTDGSGSTRYCYDRFGNLTRKVQVTNGESFTLRYSYSKAGQLASVEYPDGMQVDYVRDGLGRATEVGVTPSGGSRQVLLTGASYHPFGPVAGWTFGNGRTLSRTLDLDYRPRAILSTGTGAGGLNLGFGWDAVGNVASLHTSGLEQPPRISLDYDGLNRLIAFRDGPTAVAIEQYAYDATGNRTSFTNAHGTQAYNYPTDSHRLIAVGGVARAYDAMGNTTSIGGVAREFTYNAAGRLSEVQRDNVVAMQYAYNGRGEQVRKHLSTSNMYSVYNESGQWLGEYRSAGVPTQQIVWLDNFPVGVFANGQLNYIEADHLGTPRAVIEPQRDVSVWTWDIASEAFGDSPPNQDPDGDGAGFVLDMRLPGQRADAASGLSQNYFRDYDPGTGRYVESDPIGLAGGITTFGYANADALGTIDPFGLKWSKAQCDALRADIMNKFNSLVKELTKYDPISDGIGGHPMRWGVTKPGGHYIEITQLQNGLKNDLRRYSQNCREDNDDGNPPISRSVDEACNRVVQKPIYPADEQRSSIEVPEMTPGAKAATLGSAIMAVGAFLLWLVGG